MACSKKIFESWDLAKKSLRVIRNNSKAGNRPIRIYRCGFCRGLHLTKEIFHQRSESRDLTRGRSRATTKMLVTAELEQLQKEEPNPMSLTVNTIQTHTEAADSIGSYVSVRGLSWNLPQEKFNGRNG